MPSLGPPIALQRALADSVTSGSFIDTKFYVFSRRRPSESIIDKPLALYGNSSVLKDRSGYFATMLSSGFSESVLKDMNGDFSEEGASCISDYEYELDSDLEDEEISPPVSPGQSEEAMELSQFSRTADTVINPARLGQIITIRDAAFITFLAIVTFLHTGDIEFGSFGTHRTGPQQADDSLPRPSPKSVYRLADMYGIENLKALAFENIQMNISSCDIVEEVFSEFTSWYPEIRNVEICELVRALRSPSETASTREKLMTKLETFGQGYLSNSTESIISLIDALLNHEPSNSVANLVNKDKQTSPAWNDLRRAVVDSLRSGIFVDAKICAYSARLRSNKKIVEPVSLYYSRTALLKCREKLQSLASGSTVHCHSTEYEYESDSDLEDAEVSTDCRGCDSKFAPGPQSSSTGVDVPRESYIWERNNVTSILYLKLGAAKTWNSLLYYLYTGDVSFAPLHSQSFNLPSNEVSEHRKSSSAPLCSPKSMFIIAQRLGLGTLERLADQDLKSKVTAENVVRETFSRYSSTHPSVLEFETQVLMAHRSSPATIDQLKDIIKTTAGKQSHHSEALKSVIGSLITPGVHQFQFAKLRCAACTIIGCKSDFRQDMECQICSGTLVCCTICGHTAEFDDRDHCYECDCIFE